VVNLTKRRSGESDKTIMQLRIIALKQQFVYCQGWRNLSVRHRRIERPRSDCLELGKRSQSGWSEGEIFEIVAKLLFVCKNQGVWDYEGPAISRYANQSKRLWTGLKKENWPNLE